MIEINPQLAIPEDELTFTASRAGGPGGQHVNKVSTRITLHFDVAGSELLTGAQKRRIIDRLATRVTREGVLRVVCGKHRSQAANRAEAVGRFAELVRDALKPRKRRRATKVPAGERRRRLEQKRQRARLKKRRARPAPNDD